MENFCSTLENTKLIPANLCTLMVKIPAKSHKILQHLTGMQEKGPFLIILAIFLAGAFPLG